jgi:hypothetical protein
MGGSVPAIDNKTRSKKSSSTRLKQSKKLSWKFIPLIVVLAVIAGIYYIYTSSASNYILAGASNLEGGDLSNKTDGKTYRLSNKNNAVSSSRKDLPANTYEVCSRVRFVNAGYVKMVTYKRGGRGGDGGNPLNKTVYGSANSVSTICSGLGYRARQGETNANVLLFAPNGASNIFGVSEVYVKR